MMRVVRGPEAMMHRRCYEEDIRRGRCPSAAGCRGPPRGPGGASFLSIIERCGARGGDDRLLKIVETDGLRHVVEGTPLQELPRFLLVRIATDDDDCGRLRAAFEVLEHRMPVDPRHPNVEQHDVRDKFSCRPE